MIGFTSVVAKLISAGVLMIGPAIVPTIRICAVSRL